MTRSETQYTKHLTKQIDTAMATGNWEPLLCSLQTADLSSSSAKQAITYLADKMASAIETNMRFTEWLWYTDRISIGDLITQFEEQPADTFGLAQLSKNRMSKAGCLTPIAIQLDQALSNYKINNIGTDPKTHAEVYITKALRRIKRVYELYLWVNMLNQEYYDAVIDINHVVTEVTESDRKVDEIMLEALPSFSKRAS